MQDQALRAIGAELDEIGDALSSQNAQLETLVKYGGEDSKRLKKIEQLLIEVHAACTELPELRRRVTALEDRFDAAAQ